MSIDTRLRHDRRSLAQVLEQAQIHFDSLDEILTNLNEYLDSDGLQGVLINFDVIWKQIDFCPFCQGRFLNVECVCIPLKNQSLNVDSIFFPSSIYATCSQVRVVRVYYELSNQAPLEHLNYMDFIPRKLDHSDLDPVLAHYETFSYLLNEIKAYFVRKSRVRFLSAQTLQVSIPSEFFWQIQILVFIQ